MTHNISNSNNTDYNYSIEALEEIKNFIIEPKVILFVLDFTLLRAEFI